MQEFIVPLTNERFKKNSVFLVNASLEQDPDMISLAPSFQKKKMVKDQVRDPPERGIHVCE